MADRPRDARGRYLPYAITYKPTGDLFVTGGAVCPVCGALVVDTTTHNNWHLKEKR